MANDDCPVGRENKVRIKDLRDWVSGLDKSVNELTKDVAFIKARMFLLPFSGSVVGGIAVGVVMFLLTKYVL